MSGWEFQKLGEVAEIIMGTSPPSSSYNTTGDGVPLVNGPVEFGGKKPFDKTVKTKFTTEPKRHCQAGDLILCVRGSTTGRMNIAGFDSAIGRGVAAIRAKADQDWINQFVSFSRDTIYKLGTGATFPNVSAAILANLEIPMPSPAEQKRIVSILDEAFSAIAKAKENAEKNLLGARELFESYLNRVFTQQGPDWQEKPLGELVDIKHGFAFKSKFFVDHSDHIVLTPGSFYEEGGFRDRGEKTKYYEGEIPDGFIHEKGDFIVAMTEQAAGLLGSSLIVPESNKYLHNQRLGLVQPKPDVPWCNEFFHHVFNTRHFRGEVHQSASGVKVRHTSPKKMYVVDVAYPPTVGEQRKVAKRLDESLAQRKRLETIYTQKLANLDELKQSLLQKAFTGQLTRDSAMQEVTA